MRSTWAPTTVHGTEHLDGLDGPVVVVANHTSHADTMVLLTALPRRLRRRLVVAAAADYFFKGGVSGFLSSLFFGAIPVDRQGVSRSTLEECHQLLGAGWSLLIYPEGGRSPDGEMQAFKPGAAWIARRAGVPVVPVHLDGAFRVLPKGRSWPRRHAVTVTLGEPMWVRPDEDARAFNRRVQARVEALAPSGSAPVERTDAAQRDEAV
jgi:1-acyl-sn-glycerol-3-phosphate acyltransferase